MRAAIQAAKLRRRAAVVERFPVVGGACVNTGTIPSKTMREAILHLTGLRQRGFYGQGYRVKAEVTFEDIARRTQMVVEREHSVIRDQLTRNHVTLIEGTAALAGPNAVTVCAEGDQRLIRPRPTGVATGNAPSHPADVEFAGQIVVG